MASITTETTISFIRAALKADRGTRWAVERDAHRSAPVLNVWVEGEGSDTDSLAVEIGEQDGFWKVYAWTGEGEGSAPWYSPRTPSIANILRNAWRDQLARAASR